MVGRGLRDSGHTATELRKEEQLVSSPISSLVESDGKADESQVEATIVVLYWTSQDWFYLLKKKRGDPLMLSRLDFVKGCSRSIEP